MKRNLLVSSYDYELSRQVAKALAEGFSMRFFDQKELFEFDHIPRSFGAVCEEFGLDYVQKELRTIIKGELEFDDAVLSADMSFADNCVDLFYKIRLSNFVVFMYKSIDIEMAELSQKAYHCDAEKLLVCPDQDKLEIRENSIKMELADVVVDVASKTIDQIVDEIVDKIKNYYSVN